MAAIKIGIEIEIGKLEIEGDGHGGGCHDHNVGPRTGRGLQRPVHGAGHQHHDQKAHEAEAGLPQLHVATAQQRVGRRGCHFHRRVAGALHRAPLDQIGLENHPQNALCH